MKTSGWIPQPVRTFLLSIVFVSHHIPHLTTASSISNSYSNDTSLVSRTKRQYGGGYPGANGYCPPNCIQCNFNQCNQMFSHHPQQQFQQQHQQPRCMPMIINCCCLPHMPPKLDIKTACDGDEAVSNGKTAGEAVNGMCPAGFAPNDNNFCCAIGAGSVLGKCVNGLCPAGYACGAGDLCYAKSSSTLTAAIKSFPMPNKPVIRSRNKVPVTRRIAQGKGGVRRTKTRKTNNRHHAQPSNGEQSWIDEEGNVVMYNDYDAETPLMNEGLGLINVFNAAPNGQFF
uniref:CC domain-containing protein n=1 Tax=Ditylenchus dipsaci TaxID=166011 RepID=A0A915D7E0_9BILA